MNKVLKDREKTIIERRYGLANRGCKTQREIANMLGISRSYINGLYNNLNLMICCGII
ncbi:sigma factor-like helix-turn-helix DNA-binding protein [Brassicibacter mesophilus]|uniref:sigma factor-like helix-turn-helix DNA-binding protein n=1 Tax=Brassicibacter mesophilus TaxID=745119 RepID=UPI003D261819